MSRRRETLAEWSARLDARQDRLKVAPHVVYWAFDEFGTLLYIGCTVNFESRMGSHRGTSLWRRYMTRYECEGFTGIKEESAAA